jgi:hypothetical protein
VNPPEPEAWVAPDTQPEAPPVPAAAAPAVHRRRGAGAGAGRPEVPVALRPLGAAEKLDAALRILKLAPATVLTLTAVAVVPVELLATAVLRLDDDPLPRAVFGAPIASAFTDDTGAGAAVPLVFFVLDALALAWVAAGLSQLVTGWHVGRRDDAATLLRRGVQRLPALLLAVVLVHLAEGVGLVALVVGALVPMAWFALVAPVIGAERLGAVAAMGRSFSLTKRAFVTVLATGILVAAVAAALRIALAGLGALALASSFPGDWVLVTAIGIAVRLVLEPLVAGTAVLLYLDLRVRHEGLDIELAAIERLDRA